MYWYGHLAIDPSHMTTVRRKPTKGFRRFAEILTVGLLSEKEELETFTALAILQEINRVFRSLSITDLVRISKDDQVLYEDKESRDSNDMQMMIERVESQQRSTSANGVFESLSLLVEHHLEKMAVVAEVRILRAHAVGFYPIQIVVNGLAAEFAASSPEQLEQQMGLSFAHQASYDALVQELNEEFEGFMNQLELAIRAQMQINDLHKTVRTKLVRPRTADAAQCPPPVAAGAGSHTQQDPVFERHGATSDAFMYCWMWSSMLHSNNLFVHDTTVVDEAGQDMFNIGPEGIEAGETTALDPSVPIAEADVAEWDSLQPVEAEIDSRNWGASETGDGSGGGWLGDFGIGDFTSDGGSDAGGCGASCGGGCGGCGGS